MAKTSRLVKSFYRLFLPVITLLISALIAAALLLLYTASTPPRVNYLVTPEKYGQLSPRGAQVKDETWTNRDGTTARGWLLKGDEGAPAVILLHRYGADRSHVLDLAIKLNEATNFTVLMPDQRGHGVSSTVTSSSFGGCEGDDALAAIEFLRGLSGGGQTRLIGQNIGVYGVEMGALAGLAAAAKDAGIKALALDSVPTDSNVILTSAIEKKFPFASSVTSQIANLATPIYFYNGCYRRGAACDTAKLVGDRRILLLAGLDAPYLQESTVKVNRCFPNSNKTEAKIDLNPSGYGLAGASLEQSAAYDQRIVEFFRTALNR